MARTELTVQDLNRSGVVPSYASANVDGNAFDNDGHRIFVHIKNASASTVTITFQTQGNVDGIDIPDKTVSINNASEKMIGPFPHALYCKADNTLSITPHAVWVDYSAVTSVTIAVLKLAQPAY